MTRFPGAQSFEFDDPDFQDSIAQMISLHDIIPLTPDSIPLFNPNTVEYDSLLKWGLDTYIATNLVKYRDTGGQFNKSSDLKMLYGMTDSIWHAISPSIQIPSGDALTKPLRNQDLHHQNHTGGDTVLEDLNEVDSTWLQSIYGIGPVLSKRIVKYRNLLGGFYSRDQLQEVYGLSDEALVNLQGRISLKQNPELIKIDLNKAILMHLAAHPYISFNQAKAIIAYREQHGMFMDTEELKKIHLIDDSTYLRVYPYLDF